MHAVGGYRGSIVELTHPLDFPFLHCSIPSFHSCCFRCAILADNPAYFVYDTKPYNNQISYFQVLVHLPNNTILDGQLLFFNDHYRIMLLEVVSDTPLQPANFGSTPKFGQDVFALSRDYESSMHARRGTVLWQEPPNVLEYMYYCLSLSCQLAPVNSILLLYSLRPIM